MLKQLRPSVAAGSEQWEEHWRQFAEVRDDRAALKWDGILDIIDRRIAAGRMLEAGCGLGKYLVYARREGGQAIGIDFAIDALQTIAARAPGTPLVAGDLGKLPFGSGTFDTVLCFGVLEHFEAGADEQARGLVELLRPGGWLVVTVPYASLLKRRRAAAASGDVIPAGAPLPSGMRFYQHCFTRDEARSLVQRAGCEVILDRRISRLFWLLGPRAAKPRAAAPPTASQPGAARPAASTPWTRALAREAAYLAQWAIPGDLTSHMIAVVGRKPFERSTV